MRKLILIGLLAAPSLALAADAPMPEANCGKAPITLHDAGFDKKASFSLSGTLSEVKPGMLIVTRKALPPVTVCLASDSALSRDGQKVATDQLQSGDNVKLSFDLAENRVIAREVKAKSLKK